MAEKRIDRRNKQKMRQSLAISGSKKEESYFPYTPITEKKSIIDRLIESSPACQER
jgi:hypothetical protein